jgi:ribonucleotide reductase alpha subunit
VKGVDFNFPAPLDMTNVSLIYDDAWLKDQLNPLFIANCRQALMTGEPGFSFNFGPKEKETLRNAPVAADTWVMTNNGYRQVGDIVGQLVSVWTGKQWAMTTFKKTKEMVPTITIKMTGRREITCDPSHEFLVERYKGAGKARRLVAIDRVPASQLEPGTVLHVSLPDKMPARLDRQAYTLGFVFGDGSIRSSCIDLSLCTDEKKALLPYFEQLLIKHTVDSDTRGYTRLTLKKFWDSKAEYPHLVMGRASFLAGLFDADGSYDPSQHRIRLASVDYDFLTHVRRDLEMLGVQANIVKGGESGYGGRSSYLLVVAGSSVSRFWRKIPTNRLRGDDFTPYRQSAIKVVDISEGPIQDVYCCDVGVEEHSFCAEGVIISNCTEVTSEDDSDVCNLGSLNLSRIDGLTRLMQCVELATLFLLCGTLKAVLPYDKVYAVREKNRRLGLGLMGVHEWLLNRNYRYEVTAELHDWLAIYEGFSDVAAKRWADKLGISRPVAVRAIAPTGTIGIMAGTTGGIEPIFAVAYKRRYLKNGTDWHYQYVVDPAAEVLVKHKGWDPDAIETAIDLAGDVERRIKFQADIQDYVDQSISSTINLPAWGTDLNNEDKVEDFAKLLAKYAPRLRGLTCYPDGGRGGQPLTRVSYAEAKAHGSVEYKEHNACRDGVCGI